MQNKKKQELLFKAKNNRIIRAAIRPLINHKRIKSTKEFEKSIEAKRLRDLRNIYRGQRCFIIGNGPSLCTEDLERLHNEVTFAANRIYRIFDDTSWRPDYYVAFEPEFVSNNIDELVNVKVKKDRFLNYRGYRDNVLNTYWINCTSQFCIEKESIKSISFSDDISKYVGDGYSVTFTILQIALYMGFSEIYLLGMDHNKGDTRTNHYYIEKKTDYNTPTFWDGMEYAYSLAKEHAEKDGKRIINLTRGGQLDVFPRMDFDKVVRKDE